MSTQTYLIDTNVIIGLEDHHTVQPAFAALLAELSAWEATADRPVKVINYLLAAYIEPAITLDELHSLGVVPGHPPQSIFELSRAHLDALLPRMNLGFAR